MWYREDEKGESMKDCIKKGDIVCFASGSKIQIGVVARVAPGCGEYVIVPFRGNYAKKRKADELITARRLLKITENARYVR